MKVIAEILQVELHVVQELGVAMRDVDHAVTLVVVV